MSYFSKILFILALASLSNDIYSKDNKTGVPQQKNKQSDAEYLTKIKSFSHFYNCPFGDMGTLIFSENEALAFPLFLSDLFDKTLLSNKNDVMITFNKVSYDKTTASFLFQITDAGDTEGKNIETTDYRLMINDNADEIDATLNRTMSDNPQYQVSKAIKCSKLTLPKPKAEPPTPVIPVNMVGGRWKSLGYCFDSTSKQGVSYELTKDNTLVGKHYDKAGVLTAITTVNKILNTSDPLWLIFEGSQNNLTSRTQLNYSLKLQFTDDSYRIMEATYNGLPDVVNGYKLSTHEQTPINYKCND